MRVVGAHLLIGMLPIGKVIAAVAVAYGMFMTLLAHLLPSASSGLVGSMMFMTGGFAFLSLFLAFMFTIGWRYLWKWIPKLNEWVFPDLRGRWSMTIRYTNRGKFGEKQAIAEIKQSMLKVSMEVESEDSDSKTLFAMPKKDPQSDGPVLLYAYEVVPHAGGTANSSSYKGLAVLTLDLSTRNHLSGNYFTDRNTKGRFTLTRIS